MHQQGYIFAYFAINKEVSKNMVHAYLFTNM